MQRRSLEHYDNALFKIPAASGGSLPVIDRPLGPSGFPLHGVLGADLVLRCRAILDSGRQLLEVL